MAAFVEGESEVSGSPSLSPSPPPPPPTVCHMGRWTPGGSAKPRSSFQQDHDLCPQCRRNNSVRSATTVNSYTATTLSSNTRKDALRPVAKLQRMPAEDEDSCPIILERDLNSLHRNVPALKRHGVDTAAIRQHFYPEGGWGWIICGAGFIVHIFTSGLQMSFGLLYLHTLHLVGDHAVMDVAWIGSTCLAISRLVSPLVIAICRRKSTRLTAVLGGLVLSLGCLFTSFAHQIHQVMVSYGLLMGVGVCMVRETSSLMLGNYFKKRREFVEMVSQAGTGIGITLISVFYKEAVGKLGWRLGLQAITGILSLTFFLGILYRSASLYHPQRRAIVHLKNQKKKIKEKKGHRKVEKPPLLDFSPLKIRSVQILLLSSGTGAFGIYSPIFFLAVQGYKEGLEFNTLVLLETFLGFAATIGCVGFGLVIIRPSENCLISRQYLCQAALIGLAVALLALGTLQGYHGYALFVWLYGICLGGFSYSLKMLTMERMRAKHFTKTWGFVQSAEAIPVLIGVPITGYINLSHPKAGYYVSFFAALVSATLFYFVGMPAKDEMAPLGHGLNSNNNPRDSFCICQPISPRHHHHHLPKSISFGTTFDLPEPPMGCIAEERLPHDYYFPCTDYMRTAYSYPYGPHRTLRACKSVPEGLSRYDWQYPPPVRQVHVIEQMTTSV